jgi:hypothetical protein
MAGYSFCKHMDITFAYVRSSGGIGRDAARFYHETFPDQKQPNRQKQGYS